MKISRLCLTLLASGLLLTACIAAPHHAVTEETVISFTPMEDLAAAQAALDFPLLVPDPADLPTGLALQSVYVIPGGEQGSATLEYGAGEQTLTLHISTVPAHAQGFEWRSDLNEPYTPITVRGTEGYWASRIGELIWIEGGRLYHLHGDFSRDDMLNIAEGLHPFEPPATEPTATPASAPPQPPSSLPPTLPPAEVLGITPSPPSTDSVLLARQDGALVLHDLADGHQRVLLASGLYDVSGDLFLVPILWPVRLSPDGQWLLVPTPRDGAWLVSFDGQVQRQVSQERLTATWAPDSRHIAFTGEKGPREREEDKDIHVQDVVGEEAPRLLARLPESASYPTWSPSCDSVQDDGSGNCGRSVAAFSCEFGEIYTCTARLIDATSGEVRTLGHFVPRPTMSSPAMFAWSPDGDEVWVSAWFGARAFPVDGSGPRPLVSVCQLPCGAPSPDGTLRAWAQPIPAEANRARLVVARVDSVASVTFDTVFQQLEAVHWTSDGWRVLVKSYTGDGYTLWAVDPAAGQPELVAEKITFLGTLDELRRRSTEVGARRVTLHTLPAPGDPSTWAVHDLPDLGVRLRAPAEWRLEIQGSGITQTATLANFDFEGATGNASLGSDQIEITFDLLPSPPAVNFTAWLSQTVEMEQSQVTVEPIMLAGRPAARIRAIVSPIGEEVRVPMDEGELVITRWPISSTHDAVFEEILDSLEFVKTCSSGPGYSLTGRLCLSGALGRGLQPSPFRQRSETLPNVENDRAIVVRRRNAAANRCPIIG